MALRSLLRNTPSLGAIRRPGKPLSSVVGSVLMPNNLLDSYYSEEVLTRQREKVNRLLVDYNTIRQKLNQDMDSFLEFVRRDSNELSRLQNIVDIFEKTIHVVFFGVPVVFLTIGIKYEIDILVYLPLSPWRWKR
ncbi:uncharacterized protein LOC119300546 [Triticum dicoccoides]|uniref:uncharacterized protein LOC119300546 n=1 Tax=Triticum dicoccoides TaxID=85692 RepID=UPI000E7C2B4E|nr:uncharacterized protein LOC119300546 [Triticum dicoccoides]